MPHFNYRTELPVNIDKAFNWHEQPGAFSRLSPPWESIEIVSHQEGVKDGDEVVFRIKIAPGIWKQWHARHLEYKAKKQFCDQQINGPFQFWKHYHRFAPLGDNKTALSDEIEYELPFSPFSNIIPKDCLNKQFRALFKWRKETLQHDLEQHQNLELAPQKIAITGSSGLVGSSLIPFLTTGGHEVHRLSRLDKRKSSGSNQKHWDPTDILKAEELEKLEGISAVVHLAGESILGLWSDEKKKRIRDSRVEGTRNLCLSLAALKKKPKVLVAASAIGIYGDRGKEELTESSNPGEGFLASVGKEWEEATEPARQAGIRVVNLRIGMVLTPKGGALKAMLPPFRAGIGGPLGSGKQYTSWIMIDDLLGLILHAIGREELNGPMNAVSPSPITNKEFTKILGKTLSRPTLIPAPSGVLRVTLGDFAREVLLCSSRVLPEKALASGYSFRYPDLEKGLSLYLGN